MQSSSHSYPKNLRLQSQQAHVLSINVRIAFAEHGRMDLKSTVSTSRKRFFKKIRKRSKDNVSS